MSYAKAKYAFGFCDKTGFKYPLKDLVPEYNNGVKTGFLVGRDVVDPDQPQNFLGRLKINDPQSLRNPRPDTSLIQSRALYGFDPVGNDAVFMTASVGRVSVITTNATAESLTGVSATGSVGSVTVATTTADASVSVTGLAATGGVGSVANVIADTFTVTVANPGSGNKYYIDGVLQATLTLSEGQTYVFNWSAATSHPLRFSTTSDGTHGGGSEYTTGVVKDDSAYTTTITVAASAPTLYYYCQYHSGMGGQLNTT
jgi:plastocyanin